MTLFLKISLKAVAILPLEAKLVANRGEVDDCRNGQGPRTQLSEFLNYFGQIFHNFRKWLFCL